MGNEFGSFSGNPKTEWLIDANGEDRDMQLLEDFFYIDPAGRTWPAPKGSIINGASIPRALWTTVGSPYTDDYRRASVVHDVACDTPSVSRKEADEMFYSACRAGGCNAAQARVLYLGVRIGAWSGRIFPDRSPARMRSFRTTAEGVASPSTADERFIQDKFFEIADELRALPDDSSITELDAVIERHLKI